MNNKHALSRVRKAISEMGYSYVDGRLVHKEGAQLSPVYAEMVKLYFTVNASKITNPRGIDIDIARIATAHKEAMRPIEARKRREALEALQQRLPDIQKEISETLHASHDYALIGMKAEIVDGQVEVTCAQHPELWFRLNPHDDVARETRRFAEATLEYAHDLQVLYRLGVLPQPKEDTPALTRESTLQLPDGKQIAFNVPYRAVINDLRPYIPVEQRFRLARAEHRAEQKRIETATDALHSDSVIMIMDSGPLQDLCAPRRSHRAGTKLPHDPNWLEMLSLTSRLPNMTVIIPVQVGNLEVRGCVEEWDNDTFFTVNHSCDRKDGCRTRVEGADRMQRLLRTAYRVRTKDNGELEVIPPSLGNGLRPNPHLILWETPVCRSVAEDLLEHRSNLHKHIGRHEGEQAITQLLNTKHPLLNHPMIVLSDDTTFLNNECPHSNAHGKPVGRAGINDYVRAEMGVRRYEMIKRLKLPDKFRWSDALRDMQAFRDEDNQLHASWLRKHGGDKSNGKHGPMLGRHEIVGETVQGATMESLEEMIRRGMVSRGPDEPAALLAPYVTIPAAPQPQSKPAAHAAAAPAKSNGTEDAFSRILRDRMQMLRMDSQALADEINRLSKIAHHRRERPPSITAADVDAILAGACPTDDHFYCMQTVLVTKAAYQDERWHSADAETMLRTYQERCQRAEAAQAMAVPRHQLNGEIDEVRRLLKGQVNRPLEQIVQGMNQPDRLKRPGNFTVEQVQQILEGQQPLTPEFVTRFITGVKHAKGRDIPSEIKDRIHINMVAYQLDTRRHADHARFQQITSADIGPAAG